VNKQPLPSDYRGGPLIGGEERASIGTEVNAEGLFLISMNVRERATAPMQMAPAIIAPTMSPQVARSSIRGSCAFMLLSFHTKEPDGARNRANLRESVSDVTHSLFGQ